MVRWVSYGTLHNKTKKKVLVVIRNKDENLTNLKKYKNLLQVKITNKLI